MKEKILLAEDGTCDILIVSAERKDYAVAAPSYKADKGDLVEFRVAENATLVGRVTHSMHCERFGDAWGCLAAFTRIHDAVSIYGKTWDEKSKDT